VIPVMRTMTSLSLGMAAELGMASFCVDDANPLAPHGPRTDERGAGGHRQQRLVQAAPVDQEAGDEDADRRGDRDARRAWADHPGQESRG
jgi:hypothetical protein